MRLRHEICYRARPILAKKNLQSLFSSAVLGLTKSPKQFTILNLTSMASRNATRALQSSLKRLASPTAQRRTFVAALNAPRAGAIVRPRAAVSLPLQQTRGVKTIDFAGTKETVYGAYFFKRQGELIAYSAEKSARIGLERSFL